MDQQEFVSPSFPRTTSPLVLSPWEHFAALKSFVAGIAELGIQNILIRTDTTDDGNRTPISFGFNDRMQDQVLGALLALAPISTQGVLRDRIVHLVESAPLEWILPKRDQLLEPTDRILLVGIADDKRAPWGDPNKPGVYEGFENSDPSGYFYPGEGFSDSITNPEIIQLLLGESFASRLEKDYSGRSTALRDLSPPRRQPLGLHSRR